MNGKFALSLAVSAFILAFGGLLAVWSRLGRLEASVAARAKEAPPPERPRERPEGDTEHALASKDVLEKLDFLIEKVRKDADDAYETSVETSSDMHALKREVA